MSQTNIEQLFQLTAAVSARAPGSGVRANELQPDFGAHFNWASTTADATSKTPDRPNPAPEALRTSSTTTLDVAQGPATSEGSDHSGSPDLRQDRPAENSSEAAPSDESSTADTTTDSQATTPTEVDGKDSSSDEGNGKHADEPDQPTADAASAASAQIAVATVDESAKRIATIRVSTDEASALEESGEDATNEKPMQIAGNKAKSERPADRVAAAATRTEEPDQTADAAVRAKTVKRGDAESDGPTDATAQKGKKDDSRSATRTAANGELALETKASIPANRPGESSDLPNTGDRANKTRPNADEPRHRAAGPASRSEPATMNVTGSVVASVVSQNSANAAANAGTAEDSSGHPVKASGPKADALANLLAKPNGGASGTTRSSRAADGEDMPRVDPARFVGRVAKAFQTAHERGGTLQLRLSPPELGSLRLELTVKDGVMTAALETETPAARRVLLDHLPALRDRLAEQNIRVERFDVDVRRDGSGGQSDGRAAQQQQDHQHPDQPPPRRQPAAQPNAGEPAPRETPTVDNRIHNAMLNIVA